jgi:hypothetical protein
MRKALTRELARCWAAINRDLFSGAMRPPLLLVEDTSRRLGAWSKKGRTLSLSSRLLDGHPWGAVIEVLKHEMAHQYVDEVLGIHVQTAHGPAFRRVCAERSIDARAVGAPKVSTRAASVLRKVEGLLALADSENEHEARAAMGAAHRLMRKHNVGLTEASTPDVYSFRQLGRIRRRLPAHEKILAGILGQHFFVQPIWVSAYDTQADSPGRVLELCGRPENLDIATHVYGFMLETSERLWRAHQREQGIRHNKDRRRYLQGLMMGFNDRLSREAEQLEETGLVWVGDGHLRTWMGRRHPRMKAGRRTTMTVDSTWVAGRAAGQKVVWRKPVTKKAGGIRGLLGLR